MTRRFLPVSGDPRPAQKAVVALSVADSDLLLFRRIEINHTKILRSGSRSDPPFKTLAIKNLLEHVRFCF